MSNIPKAEKVFNDLSESFPVVYSALGHGTFKAKEFFENQDNDENKIINKFLAPNLVRYYAKMMLKREGREVFEEDDKFQINQIPNNGLCYIHDQYLIRILKSFKGELPTPGQSESRQKFYSQQQTFKFSLSEGTKNEYINLLLLWDVDSHYNLTSLSLACPKAGNTTVESVKTHWHCEIPNSLLLCATSTHDIEARESKVKELDLVIKQPIVQKKVDSK